MNAAKQVIVGIDGSAQALAAAALAAGQASAHNAALILLYVIDHYRALTPNAVKAQRLSAVLALHDAEAAVRALHPSLTVECDTVCGDPGTVLTERSWSAALMCVGGPKAVPHGPTDSLAADLAAGASCTVAVVPARTSSSWARCTRVAAIMDFSSIDYDVLQLAMEQAQSDQSALQVISKTPAGQESMTLLNEWARRYSGLRVSVVQRDEPVRYVVEHRGSIRAAFLCASDRNAVMDVVELARAKPAYDANPAVFVVRGMHL